MKTTLLRYLPCTPLLAALLAFSWAARAQPAPDNPNPNPDRPVPRRPLADGERPEGFRPGMGAGGMGPGMGGQFFPLMERVLTEEQRASLREAMAGQREAMREIEGKLRDARRELLKVSLTEKFDEEAVRTRAQALGKLEAELTVLRAKAFSEMKPALSPDQIERLKNPPMPEGGEPRREPPLRPQRRDAGPRDEHDLPPKAK